MPFRDAGNGPMDYGMSIQVSMVFPDVDPLTGFRIACMVYVKPSIPACLIWRSSTPRHTSIMKLWSELT